MRKTALLALILVSYWANARQHSPLITQKNTDDGIERNLHKTQKFIVTGTDRGRISLWDANTGHMKSSALIPEGLTLKQLRYNAEKNFVVAVCSKTLKDALLFIWNPETDDQNFVSLSITQQAKEIRICDDNSTLLVSYPDNSIEYIELPTAKKLFRFKPTDNHQINLQNTIISKNKKLMFIPTSNGEAYIFDIATQTQIKKLEGINTQTAIFSPDGASLLIITEGNIKIYNTQTWEITTDKALPKLENGTFSTSPQGDKIVYKTNTGEQNQNNLAVYKAATTPNRTIAIGFAADGKTLSIDFEGKPETENEKTAYMHKQ